MIEHEGLLMCNECYGLIKDKLGVIYLKENPNIKLCDCKQCHRGTAYKIDKNIFNIVQILNLKGYYTAGSCEGHGHKGMVITFKEKQKHITKKNIPNGFKIYERVIFSTKDDYISPKEKREDYKRILNWINKEL